MGEVYRARDSRLNRDVALKILPEAFASDPERLARFEREAQVLAALNHPHIAAIYGIEEKDGVRALVLELVEGDTLDEQIKRGPLPVGDTVRLSRQIADALEAAHELGITHRDLKPANIKITADGAVKVLDFGLAKLNDPNASNLSSDPNALSMSPTMASPAMVTGMHVLLGTVGYMAPEQARGKAVDKRADIWAFGVVVYEMLTGARAFEGDTVTEVAGAVIHKTLDLNALPAATPPVLRMVVERCLQKEPKQRFRDMGDVRLALDGAFTVRETPPVAAAAASAPRRVPVVPMAAAVLLAALGGAAAMWGVMRPAPASREMVRFDIPSPVPKALTPIFDISPDGRTVAFIALDSGGVPRVWVRPLDAPESRMLSTTEEFQSLLFWSPDSRYVAVSSDGKIKRLPVAGGPAETIVDAPDFSGGSWNRDGTIVYSANGRIMRVAATGGQATAVAAIDKARLESAHLLPTFLPDGKHFLYMRFSSDQAVNGVYVGSIDEAPEQQSTTRLLASAFNVGFAPSTDDSPGRLLFVRDGLLMAQPFDDGSLTLSGDPVPVISERIEINNVYASFAVSPTGTLIYRKSAGLSPALMSVDRTGKGEPLLAGAKFDRPGNPRLSPDGRRIVVISGGQIWAYDLSGRPPIKLTSGSQEHFTPLWTPDGQRVVFELGGARERSLFAVAADGGGKPEPIGPQGHFHPHGWTSDGQELIAASVAVSTGTLVAVGIAADAKPRTLVDGQGGHAAVSPDGRWVAYTADTTGRVEIWVRPLAGNAAAVRVSPGGGIEPLWAKNGRELYYLEDRKVMAVTVQPGTEFNFSPPVALFTSSIVRSEQFPSWDVTADGRFIMFAADDPDLPISVVTNWTAARERAPAEH